MQENSPPVAESRFRHLLEAAPDAIIEVDAQGQILLMNAATEKLFGYEAGELAGQNVEALVPEAVRGRHTYHRANYVLHPMSRPMGSGLLLEGQRKDGSRFPVEISLSPYESDGELRVGAIIRDVTERVRAEEQIQRLRARYTEELTAANRQLELRNREIEAANQLKSEFLASMSHELRTPLHTIIGFAELLSEGLEGDLNERQLRFVHHILRDGKHLLELINDILDLSKIESGRLELQLAFFNWPEALQEVLDTIRPQAEAKEILLSAEVPTAGRIFADRVRFREILLNLLSNAVKFTPAGGRILVEAVPDEKELMLSVRDTGIGIPEEHQRRIFDKFYQAGHTTRGVREGTGLGLAITKQLVEFHGGRIAVVSSPGSGSTFTCTLPLEGPGRTRAVPEAETEADPPLVLIVHPDEYVRELIVNHLRLHGYRIAVANSVQEAVDKAREFRPDAITLDLLMPDGPAWAALRTLRDTAETATIPAIAFSGATEGEGTVVSSMVTRWVKPVNRDVLLRTLQDLVRVSPGIPTKILVVDDEQSSLQFIQEVLSPAGYLPILNNSGREALETLAKTQVAAAIINLVMPDMSGCELIFRIREDPGMRHLPLLLLAEKELSAEGVELLQRETGATFLKETNWREDLVSHLRKLVKIP